MRSPSASPRPQAVPIAQLKRRCLPDSLGFVTTKELFTSAGQESTASPPPIQARALASLALGVGITSAGHNVYVMGLPGSGRHAAVREYLERIAPTRTAPDDWCYLNRFDDPQRPRAVRLPPGRGTQLKADVREMVQELRTALAQALESDAHRNRRAQVEREFEQRARESLEALRKLAERAQLVLIQAPDGFGVAPVRNGEVLPRGEFEKLPEDQQRRLRAQMEAVSEKVRAHFEAVPRWARDQQRRLRELDRDAIASIVNVHIAELRSGYTDCPPILDFLDKVQADLVDNAAAALRSEPPPVGIPGLEHAQSDAGLSRYDVNVLVDARAFEGAPVVYEGNPTYQNLIGQIDNVARYGVLTTDFSLVRSGALHRANGGFLILDAERLLAQPFAWEALKHALFEQCVRIEPLGQHLSLISTVTLEPDRIPLNIRVILIGTRHVYELMCQLDPEFSELFKVPADFDDIIDRNPENERRYADVIARTISREHLTPFDAAAIARLIEHGSRLAGDSRKLSMHLRSLEDTVREAHHFATAGQDLSVTSAHVERAIGEHRWRLARSNAAILEAIQSRTLLIDFDGDAVGQVNGLSVMQIGELWFGQPSRITATVRVGTGDVIDIEREVKLGGAIHSKGVLILSSLIGSRFGISRPLSLQASLVFEQSYGAIDGDSASLAEACALLSAISNIALRQSFGVTGSVNQHGVVQAIGGVNEKIEGYFDACRRQGLTGSQGVIIPADNVPHLMLGEDVIAAVVRDRFRVYAVRTLDDAIELLSGYTCGAAGADGCYPAGSFNERVDTRLSAFARRRQEFAPDTLRSRRSGAAIERD